MVPKTIRKKKTNETVKQELLNSLKENDNLEEHQVLMKQQMRQQTPVKRYKKIIKTQNKRVKGYAGKLDQLLKKFKGTEQYFQNVEQSKVTIYFKMRFYKFWKKWQTIKKSALYFNFLKKNF